MAMSGEACFGFFANGPMEMNGNDATLGGRTSPGVSGAVTATSPVSERRAQVPDVSSRWDHCFGASENWRQLPLLLWIVDAGQSITHTVLVTPGMRCNIMSVDV